LDGSTDNSTRWLPVEVDLQTLRRKGGSIMEASQPPDTPLSMHDAAALMIRREFAPPAVANAGRIGPMREGIRVDGKETVGLRIWYE